MRPTPPPPHSLRQRAPSRGCSALRAPRAHRSQSLRLRLRAPILRRQALLPGRLAPPPLAIASARSAPAAVPLLGRLAPPPLRGPFRSRPPRSLGAQRLIHHSRLLHLRLRAPICGCPAPHVTPLGPPPLAAASLAVPRLHPTAAPLSMRPAPPNPHVRQRAPSRGQSALRAPRPPLAVTAARSHPAAVSLSGRLAPLPLSVASPSSRLRAPSRDRSLGASHLHRSRSPHSRLRGPFRGHPALLRAPSASSTRSLH
jgi:hypothetical protein